VLRKAPNSQSPEVSKPWEATVQKKNCNVMQKPTNPGAMKCQSRDYDVAW
jgi:hypothetical protein